MSKELDDYTIACANVRSFERDHSEILNQYADLNVQVTGAEMRLKDFARQNGAEENECYSVTVVTKARRWYDVEMILEKAPYVRDIPGVLIQQVDKAKVETLAKNGMIPEDVTKAAYREEAMTPAVSIKRKE